jgi:cell cycle arrest protein BUB2
MKLRSQVWNALLGMYKISSMEYIGLVKRGASPLHEKIDNDVFRTCATDKAFHKVVSNDMIARLLNAFVWKAMGMFRTCEPKLLVICTV